MKTAILTSIGLASALAATAQAQSYNPSQSPNVHLRCEYKDSPDEVVSSKVWNISVSETTSTVKYIDDERQYSPSYHFKATFLANEIFFRPPSKHITINRTTLESKQIILQFGTNAVLQTFEGNCEIVTAANRKF